MTAFELLSRLPFAPTSEPGKGGKMFASRGELRRLLDDGAVLINGAKPKADDAVTLPVTELVFFPKSKERRCTMT